jgi:hypothetical protein
LLINSLHFSFCLITFSFLSFLTLFPGPLGSEGFSSFKNQTGMAIWLVGSLRGRSEDVYFKP